MKKFNKHIKLLLSFLLSLTLLFSFTSCGDVTLEFGSPLDDLVDGSTSLIFADDDRTEEDDYSSTTGDKYQTDHTDQTENSQNDEDDQNRDQGGYNNTVVSNNKNNNSNTNKGGVGTGVATPVKLSNVPAYSGKPYVSINNGIPNFSKAELTTKGYEKYSNLDNLGRCGVAVASIGKETMPKSGEERGEISSVKPSGWQNNSYPTSLVPMGWIYHRSHLIGWQLSAENDNNKNLITGTQYMNQKGMLPFENKIADYIKETGNHVAYRVTPIFSGNNLLASGVQMEAYSVEDNGKGICFNVYCYNVQDGININYATGANSAKDSSLVSSRPSNTDGSITYVLNINPNAETPKFHLQSCRWVKNMNEANKKLSNETRDSIIAQGFSPCGTCKP